MITIESNGREVAAKIARIPKILEHAAHRTLGNSVLEIVRIMQRVGLPIRYPVQWDSLKQKIFVIAKLRREHNLPYQRTGAHQSGWKSETITNGFVISNIGHKAAYVYGASDGIGRGSLTTTSGQSHIHEGRWPVFRDVVLAVISQLPDEIIRQIEFEFGNT